MLGSHEGLWLENLSSEGVLMETASISAVISQAGILH